MDARVETVIRIVGQGRDDQISVQTLSKSVNLSPSRLRQLFKMETGLSPLQYIKHVRLERAANLLQSSFLSIKEVIFQSGARDVCNFVREFKKRYGVTPSEFRVQNRTSPTEFKKTTQISKKTKEISN